MQRSARLGLGLFVLLALAAAALATRVARRLEQGGAARLELARVQPTRLAARTLARFGTLEERVLVTYYVSPAADMPAAMRRMELEVTDLLAALRARFPARFDFLVVDPGQDLAGFAARRRVAPFRVRSVTRDAWDERTVWSTLALAYGARPETLLHGIGPEHLPHLQELLVAWLEELEQPRKPRIVLAAPGAPDSPEPRPGFDELAGALEERGTLLRIDLDGGGEIPACDVLFWMHPLAVRGEQLAGLERLLASGGSVIVAGARLEPREEVRDGTPFVSFAPAPTAMAELGAHFGLALAPGLLLDTFAEELEFEGGEQRAAHWIRCIAPNQDFHRFASQPNGTLLFRAPSAFTPLSARLAELGLTAEVLATSSDESWLEPHPPLAPVELASLARGEAQAVPKQALMVALRHDHPWRGELVFAAATTPFADGFFTREHVAHGRLLDVLLDETTSSERLVLASIDLALPEPLPPLPPAARLVWRFFGVGLPVLLVLLLVHGRALLGALRALARGLARTGRRALVPLAALALVLAGVRALRAFELGLDLTAEGLNGLAPAARSIAARAGAGGAIEATLYLSPPASLPAELRPAVRALRATVDEFRRAGADLRVREVAPEDLPAAERAALGARGLGPALGESSADGVRRVTRFTAALHLARGGEELVLAFPDARAFERLEFRIALALERLGGRAVPRVAFASDVPRLSAAEAFEYQKQSLFAPTGSDVFALARAALARNDLEVVHVNPRKPELPAAFDVLVWLQPRRSIEAMLELAVRHLHGGGKLALFAQHFKLKSQQYRGGDFAPQFWPQPQNPDLELLYLPELGIELVREVLFDALCVPIETESQVTGRAGKPDYEPQASALPFQIRLSSAGFAAHPWLRGLGDQSFLWANRIRWDSARLDELGLTATPLAFTSRASWSYAWTGGWIPPELLAGPAALEKSSGPEPLGPQPLAVLFEGQFPRPAGVLQLNPSPAEAPGETAAAAVPLAQDDEPPEAPWPAPAPGKLLLVGASGFLENAALAAPEFRGDQMLWNFVAGLLFESESEGELSELAELATRARVPRGLGLVEPRARLLWRAAVIASGPVLLVLAAAGLAALRRRAPVRGAGGGRP